MCYGIIRYTDPDSLPFFEILWQVIVTGKDKRIGARKCPFQDFKSAGINLFYVIRKILANRSSALELVISQPRP